MRYCSAQGIAPAAVDEEVLDRYMRYRAETTALATDIAARSGMEWLRCRRGLAGAAAHRTGNQADGRPDLGGVSGRVADRRPIATALPPVPVGKAWEEVSASFDRFCLAAGIETLAPMWGRGAGRPPPARRPRRGGGRPVPFPPPPTPPTPKRKRRQRLPHAGFLPPQKNPHFLEEFFVGRPHQRGSAGRSVFQKFCSHLPRRSRAEPSAQEFHQRHYLRIRHLCTQGRHGPAERARRRPDAAPDHLHDAVGHGRVD